ncbi:MAG: hypothetical protein IJJ95_05635, partial [Spirochaetales bacterium]|nr:hypothetical protein [Spirochaetales bacterium]
KLLAFASRNRIKNRDLWDIEMLNERRVSFNPDLMRKKINDHRIAFDVYMDSAGKRVKSLLEDGMPSDFRSEMMRFVPAGDYEKSILSTEEAGRAIATIIGDYISLLK